MRITEIAAITIIIENTKKISSNVYFFKLRPIIHGERLLSIMTTVVYIPICDPLVLEDHLFMRYVDRKGKNADNVAVRMTPTVVINSEDT